MSDKDNLSQPIQGFKVGFNEDLNVPIAKQSEMKSIEIDWKKIYEINPDGLCEWLGHVPVSASPFLCQHVKFDGNLLVCDFGKGFARNYAITFKALNAKALDLIFWLDSKGVNVNATNAFGFCGVLVGHSGDYVLDLGLKSDRQTAIAAGILKAFELLSQYDTSINHNG